VSEVDLSRRIGSPFVEVYKNFFLLNPFVDRLFSLAREADAILPSFHRERARPRDRKHMSFRIFFANGIELRLSSHPPGLVSIFARFPHGCGPSVPPF